MARRFRLLLDFTISVLAFILFLVGVLFILGSHVVAVGLHVSAPNPLDNVLFGGIGLEMCVGSYLLARRFSGEVILRYGCQLAFLYGVFWLVVGLPVSFFFSWYTGEPVVNGWGGMGSDEAIFIVGFGILAVLNWILFQKKLRVPSPPPLPDPQARRWFY